MTLNAKLATGSFYFPSITLCLVSPVSKAFWQNQHPFPDSSHISAPATGRLGVLCKVAPHEITIWGEWSDLSSLTKHCCLWVGFLEWHKASIMGAGMSRCFKSLPANCCPRLSCCLGYFSSWEKSQLWIWFTLLVRISSAAGLIMDIERWKPGLAGLPVVSLCNELTRGSSVPAMASATVQVQIRIFPGKSCVVWLNIWTSPSLEWLSSSALHLPLNSVCFLFCASSWHLCFPLAELPPSCLPRGQQRMHWEDPPCETVHHHRGCVSALCWEI